MKTFFITAPDNERTKMEKYLLKYATIGYTYYAQSTIYTRAVNISKKNVF